MEKALALVVLVSGALLLSGHQPASAQVFCRSQFNLANEACSMRSFIPGPGVRRGGLPRQQQLNETSTTTSTAAAASGVQSRSSDDDDSHGGRRSRHRHQHRHSEEGEGEDPRDTACCRRLMGLDNSCVCQATARLPPFMNSVRHVITLTPVEGCEISFECPGPLF
ncbi:hypothetical protein BDA96_07G113700 [Sorghum bicolor]|jgi:hypothetical protein|uniref:Bifunctional inhibitor/plant lipid transfer protein/seed storage helical domain-containing protein n=2 Tax=Sorghum bicolor TaxID=4558 RepID=A0A921QKK5_SORBI|nr:uncharacterized protein LOC8069880 [Sorghum bicolor]EES14886.1 hypothetical protein SORBI_3007G107500 [Sorghum bicolor]KAG0523321.1 hypothetical protein BDA96_07G113700 [Sorghum bicolor]|eukprot:XP_002445391.1 uncharacterized protein LOC8069880 [Sorghum bicolor]